VPLQVEDYKITIDPPLFNVSLRSVLDAIVRAAKPLKEQIKILGLARRTDRA